MNCPNCRQDNPATTRFCTSCGAVLVENTPDGRRRRVLRPWGLGHAPLTESPAMPEIAAAREALDPRARRRLDVGFVGGVIAVTIGALLIYPYARALDTLHDVDAAPMPARVSLIADSALLDAYRLVQPAMAPLPRAFILSAHAGEPALARADRERLSRARQAKDTPAVAPPPEPLPMPRTAVVETSAALAVQPRMSVPIPIDRWQSLKQTLRHCASVDGVFGRAACEQGARLGPCDGFWGLVEHCPAGRTDYGQ